MAVLDFFRKTPVIFGLNFDRESRTFSLSARFQDRPYPVGRAIAEINRPPFPLQADARAEALVIKPRHFERVRLWLEAVSAPPGPRYVLLETDRACLGLRQMEAPPDFALTFIRSGDGLLCRPPEEVLPLGERGWFLSDKRLWRSEVGDLVWLAMQAPAVAGDMVRLLTLEIQRLRKNGVKVNCPYRYEEAPYWSVEILSVKPDRVEARRTLTAATPTPIPGLNDFVWCGDSLRPKCGDQLLEDLFQGTGSRVFTGDELALLSAAAGGPWKAMMAGRAARLMDLHRVYDSGELVLAAYSEKENGIGRAYARAEVRSGAGWFPAAALSRSISPQSAYARAENGWFPVALLEKLGLGPLGRLTDGRSIETPYELTLGELIYRGGDRLTGPWSRMALEGFARELPGKSRAYGHLRFLTDWGLSGGLNGGGRAAMTALCDLLSGLRREEPAARILAVGQKDALAALGHALTPLDPLILDDKGQAALPLLEKSPLILAESDALLKNEGLLALRQDLLVLLSPEALAKSRGTRIFAALDALKARLRIALYADSEYAKGIDARLTQYALLGIAGEMAANFLVIDPDKPLPPLPKPYVFRAARVPVRERFADVALPEEEAQAPRRGAPIPPRGDRPQGPFQAPRRQESFDLRPEEQRFLAQARALADKTVAQADFVPFKAYWPTYENMDPAQSDWYFYWRGQVRAGRYPITGLSYIFLYIYEIINLTGGETPMTAYERLSALRQAYRPAFPQLERYLPAWMKDMVLLYDLAVPEEDLAALDGAAAGSRDLNDLMLARFREKPLNLSLALLGEVSDYDIDQSRFYQSVHGGLCEDHIPKVLALVDAYLEKRQGLRLLELFHPGYVPQQRRLFSGALYMGGTRVITVNTVPVCSHQPLREFIGQVMRYTENRLRVLTGFRGRLRCQGLDGELSRLIDGYLTRALAPQPERAPAPAIVIDEEKLRRLAGEAEETRRMLTLEAEEGAPEAIPSREGQTGPSPGLYGAAALQIEQDINLEAGRVCGPEAETDSPVCPVADETPADGGVAPLDGPAEEPALQWRAFFQGLPPPEREALRALALGLPGSALQNIADRAGTMTELLFDAVNDAAMEALGDLLILDGALNEEYAQAVRDLLDGMD